jgi:hypothetical protein
MSIHELPSPFSACHGRAPTPRAATSQAPRELFAVPMAVVHGIDIVHNLIHLDTELTSYWAKLPLLLWLMLSHLEVEEVFLKTLTLGRP